MTSRPSLTAHATSAGVPGTTPRNEVGAVGEVGEGAVAVIAMVVAVVAGEVYGRMEVLRN